MAMRVFEITHFSNFQIPEEMEGSLFIIVGASIGMTTLFILLIVLCIIYAEDSKYFTSSFFKLVQRYPLEKKDAKLFQLLRLSVVLAIIDYSISSNNNNKNKM